MSDEKSIFRGGDVKFSIAYEHGVFFCINGYHAAIERI
jgi:hypothetical protein